MHISAPLPLPVMLMFLLSLVLFVSPSRAEDAPPAAETSTVTSRARAHFDHGVEHYSAGNYDAALAEFQRAYELRPGYKLLFNLAQVQMERHDSAAALHLYSEYLRTGASEIAPERAKEVEQELQRLRQSVAELVFQVDVEGARLYVNALPVGVSPLREPVLVNTGSALIRVEKAGYAPFVESVSVVGADKRQLVVTLEPLTAAAPVGLLRAHADSELVPNMTPFWISLGAAVVLGGVTTTFGVLSMQARGRHDELLASYPGRPSELDGARDRLQTFAALTDASAAATLVLGVFGLYFLLSPPERSERAAQTSLKLSATPSGVLLGGAF